MVLPGLDIHVVVCSRVIVLGMASTTARCCCKPLFVFFFVFALVLVLVLVFVLVLIPVLVSVLSLVLVLNCVVFSAGTWNGSARDRHHPPRGGGGPVSDLLLNTWYVITALDGTLLALPCLAFLQSYIC